MSFRVRISALVTLATLSLAIPAQGALIQYWPLDETSGAVAPNSVSGGTDGALNGGATWLADATRGQVLSTDGTSGTYVDAGTLPALASTDYFTWSFWTYQVAATTNRVALGNRFGSPEGGDDWIKFTPNQLEYAVNYSGVGTINYDDIPNVEWVHHAAVKSGTTLSYYRNGVLENTRTFTADMPSLPFYMGGDASGEPWNGRLDDVALWNQPLSGAQVKLLATGSIAPNRPAVFADDFNTGSLDTGKWDVVNQGLESPPGGGTIVNQVADTTTNPGQLTLGGDASGSYWPGVSARTVETFSSALPTLISVERVSLAGSGTAFRSSLWIWDDETHYLHFGQAINEAGWRWNARDDGGSGTSSPIGGGNDIAAFNDLDGYLDDAWMELYWIPLETPGSGIIEMYLNGELGATHTVTNFSDSFHVMLSGMPRADGDTFTAVFDNFSVLQTPEPSSLVMLAGLGLAGLLVYRRRRRS